MSFRIGEVANLSRISVRTLRHYDDIGLLTPSLRSDSGYRLYTEGDLYKLRQILLFKTLGFGLDTIAEALNDTTFDFQRALLEQRHTLTNRREQLSQQLALIENLLQEPSEAKPMTNTPSFSIFENFEPSIYVEEVEAKWGDSEAYKESKRRTQPYRDVEWQKIKTENDVLLAQLADLQKQGLAPTDPAVLKAIDEYRLHIDRWYYPCSKTMHAQLGQLYLNDLRFKANFDKIQMGLAEFIQAACAANALTK